MIHADLYQNPGIWLKQLQEKLLEDRRNEQTQAEPIYYAIKDITEVITEDGYQDKSEYYDTNAGESISLETIFEELEEQKPDQLQKLEQMGVIEKTEAGSYKIQDTCEFADFIKNETPYEQVYIQEMDIIKPDTLFLTRSAAEQHLAHNAHHYSKNAITYAMTAWRSPDVERLFWLLQNIDFDHSVIQLKKETRP